MQEYNWRKEREKFRPDFMKQQAPPMPAAAAPPPPPSQPVVIKRSGAGRIVAVLAIIAVIIVVLAIVGVKVARRDAASMLAQAAEDNKNAVGLVVLTAELQNGNKLPLPVATAWAFAPNKFATNAHVANGLKEACDSVKAFLAGSLLEKRAEDAGFKDDVEAYLKRIGETQSKKITEQCMKEAESLIRGFQVSIRINGAQNKGYSVSHVQIHRDYGAANTSFDPDVAVLIIDGSHDSLFDIADAGTLGELKSGEPIALLGFPMENMHNDNVNLDNPVASMQSGIVVAVSDFDMKDAGPSGNYLIRHNLPSTGGASGSPIFNRNGEVVALLFAGNVIGQVQNGQVDRAPSAVQINFAVRSDLLKDMGNPIEIQDYLVH